MTIPYKVVKKNGNERQYEATKITFFFFDFHSRNQTVYCCGCATCGGANLQAIATMRNKLCFIMPGIDGLAAVTSKSTRNSRNMFLVYGLRLDVYLCTKKW